MTHPSIKLPTVIDPVRISKSYGIGKDAKVTTIVVERINVPAWLGRGYVTTAITPKGKTS